MSNNKLLAKPLYVGCFHVGDGFLPYINQEMVYLLQPASPPQPGNVWDTTSTIAYWKHRYLSFLGLLFQCIATQTSSNFISEFMDQEEAYRIGRLSPRLLLKESTRVGTKYYKNRKKKHFTYWVYHSPSFKIDHFFTDNLQSRGNKNMWPLSMLTNALVSPITEVIVRTKTLIVPRTTGVDLLAHVSIFPWKWTLQIIPSLLGLWFFQCHINFFWSQMCVNSGLTSLWKITIVNG